MWVIAIVAVGIGSAFIGWCAARVGSRKEREQDSYYETSGLDGVPGIGDKP